MKNSDTARLTASITFAAVGGALLAAAKFVPNFAENYYWYFYRPAAGFIGTFTGMILFSMMELVIAAIALSVLIGIISMVISAKDGADAVLKKCGHILLDLFCTLLGIFFWYCVFCGTNYYCNSFAEKAELEVKDSTATELYILCDSLISEANDLSTELEHGENGATVYPESDFAMAKTAAENFRGLYDEYPFLKLGGKSFGTPKPVFFSSVMSYLQISGVYSPYTLEANVCTEGPDFLRGATMMHEQVHMRGFMNEAEANFVAFLACYECGDPYFEYSGTALALLHSMNALYEESPELWQKLRAKYGESLLADMLAQNAYIKSHESAVSEASDKINDTYLKLNSQSEGTKSYGKMVDLLLAWQRAK